MKALLTLLLVLVPTAAFANDPMAGWYLQQQARGRMGRGPSHPTGVLITPRAHLKKKPTVKPAAAEDLEKKTVEPAKTESGESATPEASAKQTQGPGIAYQLGRMVRRMLDAVGTSRKRTAAPVATATEGSASSTASEERTSRFALASPRAQQTSSPGALFLLRRARLITEADYQAGLLRFLGAR